jgi:AraC family transcriptional regulator
MTLAALELYQSDIKVSDLAVKYGYDSLSSFSRAFKAFHGWSPAETRTGNKMIKAYPRASFTINHNMGHNINYRIVKTASSTWFGKSIKIDASEAESEKLFAKVFEFGNELIEDGTHQRIIKYAGMEEESLLTSIRYAFGEDGSHKFMYGAELDSKDIDDEFEVLRINEVAWAVFKYPYTVYPETTLPLYRQIYSEWFPTSGYVQTEGACLEKCYKDYLEVWIPITKVNHETC